MVKAHNTRVCRDCVAIARELLGGQGITADSKVGRAFTGNSLDRLHNLKDMEALYTYDGTYEINSLIAGREFLGYSSFKPHQEATRPGRRGEVLKQVGNLTIYLMTNDDVKEAVQVALETFVKQQVRYCRL